MEKENNFPEMRTNADHFKHTKLIIMYARELKTEKQNLETKIADLKDENRHLKEYTNSLLHTNISIGSDESITLLYAQLREQYGNLQEEHEKLDKVYTVILNDHANLKDISSKRIKVLDTELTIKTERYEKEMAGITQALDQKNKLLQESESKVSDLQFKFDQTFGYYNEKNDRLIQECMDLKLNISTFDRVIRDANAEITILKKQKEQQLKKSTDLEDRLYNMERQLKSAQDKLHTSRPNIRTYGLVNKSNRSYQNLPAQASNSSFRSFDTIGVRNSASLVPNEAATEANDSLTTTLTSNSGIHFDSINLGSGSTFNKKMSCNVNLNVFANTTTSNPRKLFVSSDFIQNKNLPMNQEMADIQSSCNAHDVASVGKERNEPPIHSDYLDMPVVKGMYSNKKRSRKLYDPDDDI